MVYSAVGMDLEGCPDRGAPAPPAPVIEGDAVFVIVDERFCGLGAPPQELRRSQTQAH